MNMLQSAAPAFAGPPTSCTILLVDDDPACLDEYADTIEALGYGCLRTGDARAALRLIAEDPGIGIIVTDIDMPAMDGITLLDELAARFAPVRPIVPVVVTGFGSLDCAVQAMRFNAVDFLQKPLSPRELASALRRATARWRQLVGQMQAGSPSGKEPAASAPAAESAEAAPSNEDLIAATRAIIRTRQRRGDFLDAELFADPSWDILLELTLARLEGVVVPVTSAYAAAQVPYTTAFRYVKQLVDDGLVRRWQDPTDQRRSLLELEDRTLESMKSYLAATMRRTGP